MFKTLFQTSTNWVVHQGWLEKCQQMGRNPCQFLYIWNLVTVGNLTKVSPRTLYTKVTQKRSTKTWSLSNSFVWNDDSTLKGLCHLKLFFDVLKTSAFERRWVDLFNNRGSDTQVDPHGAGGTVRAWVWCTIGSLPSAHSPVPCSKYAHIWSTDWRTLEIVGSVTKP